MVQFAFQNEPEKGIKHAGNNQLIARRFIFEGIKHGLDNNRNMGCAHRKIFIYQYIMTENSFNLLLEGVTASQQLAHIKNYAIIDGILTTGHTAVDYPIPDKNHISSLGVNIGFIQYQMQGTLLYPDNFVLHMPMVGHMKSRMVGFYMIKFYGKIKAASLKELVVPFMFHNIVTLLHRKKIILL